MKLPEEVKEFVRYARAQPHHKAFQQWLYDQRIDAEKKALYTQENTDIHRGRAQVWRELHDAWTSHPKR